MMIFMLSVRASTNCSPNSHACLFLEKRQYNSKNMSHVMIFRRLKTVKTQKCSNIDFIYCRELCNHFHSLYHFILVAFSSKDKTSSIMVLLRLEFLLVTELNSKIRETDYPDISINLDLYSLLNSTISWA